LITPVARGRACSCFRLPELPRRTLDVGPTRAIAILDGASLPVPLYPTVAACAITHARAVLGDDRYDKHRRQGAIMAIDDGAAFLLAAEAGL
jgi:hypothetical protein